MISGKALLSKPRKLSYISDSKKETINCCDLQQLLYWYDETELHHTKGNFLLAANKEILVFPNMGYNFYTGRAYTPLQILTDELKIPYRDSLYLLNYFYYKVKKAPLNAALTGWWYSVKKKYKLDVHFFHINIINQQLILTFSTLSNTYPRIH